MSVTCYPMAFKGKSRVICEAFANGCGGTVVENATHLKSGAAFFYGVDDSNVHLWHQAKDDGRDWFYCDNSFFDPTRNRYYRIAKNRVQHSGIGYSNGDRWREIGIEIKSWRESGSQIILCPQSESFMRTIAEYEGDWTHDVQDALWRVTPRTQRVRGWSADKPALAATLEQDLAGAHALVTYSSAAAITAILCGVPAICTGECAATPMAGRLSEVEHPPMPSYEARFHWASVLADAQWTVAELRNGTAWRMLEWQ